MATSLSSDAALLAIVVLSCMVVILGILMCKRFCVPKFCLVWPFQDKGTRSTSSNTTHILPSVGASSCSAPSSSLGRNTLSNVHGYELTLFPSISCSPTPTLVSCSDSPRTPTWIEGASSIASSPRSSTPRADAVNADKDRLPPNVTMPIPRQTPLERMMDRWRKNSENVDGTRSMGSRRHVSYLQHHHYASKEVNKNPRIIVTLPSSKSVSPTQPSYASMLSTVPDEDPFFWDTIPLPRRSPTRASSSRPSQLSNYENSTHVDSLTQPRMRETISGSNCLPLPSGSGLPDGSRCASLEDSTNRDAKSMV